MKSLLTGAAFLILLHACAVAPPPVRDDDMSAARHRQEAQQENAIATSQMSAYEQSVRVAGPGVAGNDRAEEHRRRADESREHARQHAAAAAYLERFEDDACAGIPPAGRSACPLLGPLARLDDIPGGVRATFVDPSRVRAAVAEMRCHYAFARARHFDEAVSCPLYVRGIEFRAGLDPRAVEIVARDEETVRLIRQRSRSQAIVVRGDR